MLVARCRRHRRWSVHVAAVTNPVVELDAFDDDDAFDAFDDADADADDPDAEPDDVNGPVVDADFGRIIIVAFFNV